MTSKKAKKLWQQAVLLNTIGFLSLLIGLFAVFFPPLFALVLLSLIPQIISNNRFKKAIATYNKEQGY